MDSSTARGLGYVIMVLFAILGGWMVSRSRKGRPKSDENSSATPDAEKDELTVQETETPETELLEQPDSNEVEMNEDVEETTGSDPATAPVLESTEPETEYYEPLTQREDITLDSLGYDADLLHQLQRVSGTAFYITNSVFDYNWAAPVLTVPNEYQDLVKQQFESHPVAREGGYSFFEAETSITQYTRYVLLKTDDLLAPVRFMGTDGINYDVTTEDVISRLSEWQKRFGIKILGAGPDFVHVELLQFPDNSHAFAEEVYKFCPDTVDQNFGSLEDMDEYMVNTQQVFLWWD